MAKTSQLEAVARVAPVLRGLLAEPTRDDDFPLQPAILKSVDGRKSRPRALQLEPLLKTGTDEALRSHFAAALKNYQTKHDARPECILLPGAGAFQVVKQNPSPATTRLWLAARRWSLARRARLVSAFAKACWSAAFMSPSRKCPASGLKHLPRNFRSATRSALSACRWM